MLSMQSGLAVMILLYLLGSTFLLCSLGSLIESETSDKGLPSTPLDPNTLRSRILLRNVQGNILQDHGRSFARHVFIKFGDSSWRSKLLVLGLADGVTSAWEEIKSDHTGEFRSLLFAASGYSKLGLKESKIPDELVFRLGMQNLTEPIPIVPGVPSVANPCADPPVDTWDSPFPEDAPDALVILAGEDSHELDKQVEEVENSVTKHGGTVLDVYRGYRLKTEFGQDIEHFGFADGISNPVFLKGDYEKALNQTTTGSFMPGADPLAPLEQILVKDKFGGFLVPAYGSYLVYRRLQENVELFQEFGAQIKRTLQENNITVNQDEAEARMIGRHKDGTPLVHDLSGVKPKFVRTAINFNYEKDADGAQCPIASHIRKVNPRGMAINSGVLTILKFSLDFLPPTNTDIPTKHSIV
jgi:deferrochelatase/peroxidase EfeB